MHFTTFFVAACVSSAVLAQPAPQYGSDNAAGQTSTTTVTSGAESNTTTASNTTLITELETAAKAPDRINLLAADPSNFVFDFLAPPPGANTTGAGGHTVRSDRENFPALIGTGVSMTLGFIQPCGFNTPHTHPRSSEFNVVVQGALIAEMLAENGAKLVRHRLNTFQGSVFPQGALHTEFNPDCTPATFVAGFASEDPGVLQAAQSFLSLDDDLIQAAGGDTFSGADVDKFRAQLPPNVAMGVESCLQKCGIKKN